MKSVLQFVVLVFIIASSLIGWKIHAGTNREVLEDDINIQQGNIPIDCYFNDSKDKVKCEVEHIKLKADIEARARLLAGE